MKVLIYDWNMPYYLKDSDYPVGGATVELYAWIMGFLENGCETGLLTWEGASNHIGREQRFTIVEGYNNEKGLKGIRYFNYRLPILFHALKKYKPDILIQECF